MKAFLLCDTERRDAAGLALPAADCYVVFTAQHAVLMIFVVLFGRAPSQPAFVTCYFPRRHNTVHE